MTEKQQTTSIRDKAPGIASAADMFRTWLGREIVDEQIARATRARRMYLEIHEQQGLDAAEAWRRINWREATFYAREGRTSVGMAVPFEPENAVTPNIDIRILRAAREGGPVEAKRVEALIARGIVKGKRGVQTSAQDERA